MQGYDETRTRQFQENLHERIVNLPGVTSVALASGMPLSGWTNGWLPLITEGAALLQDDSAPHVDYDVVSAGFFATIDAHVVRGRAFTSSDGEGSAPVAIVNQALARKYWAGEDPIGKRIRVANTSGAFFDVVGVAPDLEDANAPYNNVRPTVYVPYGQGSLFLKRGADGDATLSDAISHSSR